MLDFFTAVQFLAQEAREIAHGNTMNNMTKLSFRVKVETCAVFA